MGKTLPSGSGLPACWNEEMDRCICYYDALGTVDTKSAIRKLKRKHTVLADIPLSVESIERRVASLDLMDNDYFVLGTEHAIKFLEDSGVVLPPMDLEKYSKKKEADVAEATTESEAGEGSLSADVEGSMAGVKIEDDEEHVGECVRGRGGDREVRKENYTPRTSSTAAQGATHFPNSTSTGTFGYEYNPNDNATFSGSTNYTDNTRGTDSTMYTDIRNYDNAKYSSHGKYSDNSKYTDPYTSNDNCFDPSLYDDPLPPRTLISRGTPLIAQRTPTKTPTKNTARSQERGGDASGGQETTRGLSPRAYGK